jgi:ATP-dependent DNA helicase RecG
MNLGKETETLEYKKSTGEMKEAMVSIASILNKHGIGTLYFGVKPNGTVCGQNVSESSLRDVSRAVYDNIRPQIFPAIKEVIMDGKHLIRVEFSGNDTPYSSAGRYYLRTADEDREVSPAELRNFFVANEYREKWEKTASSALATQIDRGAIKAFWQKAISVGRMPSGKYTCPIILKRFGLLQGDNLNNAGEYLFGNTHPLMLKAAIFATDEKLTFIDMRMFEDNIYRLLGIAEDYILKNIRWRSEITAAERKEIPEIPVAVIREILANSFAHAVYNGHTNHEICIHPGMVTFYSPGGYASSHKPEEYIAGNKESVIRNATIAKVLYLNKSIEQFGSGFKRIDKLCKEAGIHYTYENDEYGFKFIIYRPKSQSDIQSVTSDVTSDSSPDVTLNVSSKVSLNSTEMAVLALLQQKPTYSRNELADMISRTTRTVQRILISLKEKGFIKRVGSKQSPQWVVLKSHTLS